jgi:hypothetical protein
VAAQAAAQAAARRFFSTERSLVVCGNAELHCITGYFQATPAADYAYSGGDCVFLVSPS